MPSTPSRSTSSSPESIYTHETRLDASTPRHSHRHSSDRLSMTKIASILRYDEQQSKDLRRMLLTVTEQLKQESQRADDNERRAREAIQRFRAINEARVAAQQDAARANEELGMYKLQLDYAQKEIFRAQEILESLEAQRHDAESSAAKARSVARKLREEGLVDLAREEGHRLGLQEGLARTRRLGSDQVRSTPDRRDSRPVQSNPPHVDYREDDLRSPPPTQTPFFAEPRLEPIGEAMLSFPPSPRATSAPNPEVLSHPEPAPTPPSDFPPIVVRDTPSPSRRPRSIVPQDGFIPHAESDSSIRLPPPHGMTQPIAPSSPTLDRQPSTESEPLMVRAPGVRHEIVPLEPESPGSTTISQFELVSDPSGSVSRQSRRKRRSLSVIPESVSSDNTPAVELRSIPTDRGSRPTSASVSHGPTLASPSASRSPTFVQGNVVDGSHEPGHYVYHRPSFASSSSSGSVHVIQQTPGRSTRSLARVSSLSSVPDIFIEAPSRSQSQTPQATPYMSRAGHLLSADDAHRHMSPIISGPALDSSSSPVVPQDSSAGQAGDPGQPVLTLPDGQLPRGFVPLTVSSPSQPPPPQMAPMFSYSTPSAPTNVAVGSPRMSPRTDPRSLYGVPVPDASSSSGRLSSHNSVRVPVTSTTGESSAMVPPASIFSQPNELSTSETDEDEAVASSIASSNDTLSTPPPSRKKPKPKKSRRPTYDAAPMSPGHAYPSSPLMRANTLASPVPSATPASQGRRGPAGMTPASRNRNLTN